MAKRGIEEARQGECLYEKAWPEILSAFKTLKMGVPLEFYDALITAGLSPAMPGL